MLIIKLNNTRVELPDSFSEVSFEKVLKIADLVNDKMPKVYRDEWFGENEEGVKPEEKDTIEFMDFQCEYLSLISGKSKTLFKHIKPIEKDGIQINTQWLFERCAKLIGFPSEDDLNLKDHIEVDGKKYYRDIEIANSIGVTESLNQVDYATFATGMMINTIIDKVRQGNVKNRELIVLTATMFRPAKIQNKWFGKKKIKVEEYDAASVDERANLFMKANAADVFGAYFFLLKGQQQRLKHSQALLKKTVKKLKSNQKLKKPLTWIKWRVLGLLLVIKSRANKYLHGRKNNQ